MGAVFFQTALKKVNNKLGGLTMATKAKLVPAQAGIRALSAFLKSLILKSSTKKPLIPKSPFQKP